MRVFEIAVFLLLCYCLFTFSVEVYRHQKYLESAWPLFSEQQWVLENLNLSLMDFKLVFTVIGFILWGQWVKPEKEVVC
jgi:hypothetical protein